MPPEAQASHSESDETSYTGRYPSPFTSTAIGLMNMRLVASLDYSRPMTPFRVSCSQATNPPYPEEGDDNGDMRESFGNKVNDELKAQEVCQTNMGVWSQEMLSPAEGQHLQGQAFMNAVPEVTNPPYSTESDFELPGGGSDGRTTSTMEMDSGPYDRATPWYGEELDTYIPPAYASLWSM